MMPKNMVEFLNSRNIDNLPLIDYLTVGVFKKGALDKNLTDARRFIGVPKSYVRKLQEI